MARPGRLQREFYPDIIQRGSRWGFLAPDPDLTITVNRSDLNRIMMGVASFDQLADEGKARFEGDRAIIHTLRHLMVTFTPNFEVLPGTVGRACLDADPDQIAWGDLE